MGEVYRARDAKLGRDVAIKILSRTFTSSPDRLARFEREARMLATLNHPNICAIYGVEEADGVRFLVLELVEGETLAERIAPAPSTAIPDLGARQASAGFRRGSARDRATDRRGARGGARERASSTAISSPRTSRSPRTGVVKVLDFGLANGAPTAGDADDGAAPPRGRDPRHRRLHEPGAGARQDGRQAHRHLGVRLRALRDADRPCRVSPATRCRTRSRQILEREPDWSALPAATPPAVRTAVAPLPHQGSEAARPGHRRRQDRDRRARRRACRCPRRRRTRRRVGTRGSTAGALACALALAVALAGAVAPAVPAADLRLAVELGADAPLGPLDSQFGDAAALSPDGAVVAFVGAAGRGAEPSAATSAGSISCTRRRCREPTTRITPFFSPDGQWIGFFAGGKLKKIAVTGGAAVTLSDAPELRGGAWSEDGHDRVLAQPDAGTRLLRVSAAGGTRSNRSPSLADGEVGPFVAAGPARRQGGALHGAAAFPAPTTTPTSSCSRCRAGRRKVVQRGGYHGRYLPSGHLVYIHDGTLFAAPFDLDRLEVTGSAGAGARGRDVERDHRRRAVRGVGRRHARVSAGPDGRRRPAALLDGSRWANDVDHASRAGELVQSRASRPTAAGSPWRSATDRPTSGSTTGRATRSRALDVRSRAGRQAGLDAGWPAHRVRLGSRRTSGRPTCTGSAPTGPATCSVSPRARTNSSRTSWHPSGRFLAFEETTPEHDVNVMILPLEGDDALGMEAREAHRVLEQARRTRASRCSRRTGDGSRIHRMSRDARRCTSGRFPARGARGRFRRAAA